MIREYESMLDIFFKHSKKKKQKNFNDVKDSEKNKELEKWRERIAIHFKLPSSYAVTNHDEFWAELITNWKRLPTQAYQFKSSIKKIINRL